MYALETLFSVPAARLVHTLRRYKASRTVLKHMASHSSTNMLTEAQNGLSAGEVSCFGRDALNTPAASQPQHPQSAPRSHPLERHPPSPTLESASDFAWRVRPESLDDITSFGRRDPRRRKLVGRPACAASSATGRTSRPHRRKQRQAGSRARYGRPLRWTNFVAPDIGAGA